MDFSALLADLRDVAEKYKGQNSDPKVATIVFADMFIKILKRTETTSKKFEDRIVMLWVTLNQLAASYKDLAPVPERHELCQYIFILCAKTVLNIEWQQLDENDRNRQNFTSTVQSVHELLKDLGFNRFHLLLSLMKTHWTHPVLSRIMSGEEEDESEEGLNYILGEDPEILKLRVEMMIDENCEEFALNLCCWSLRHPDLANDQKVQQLYLFLLHKQQQFEKLQEECSKIECHNGIKIINALEKKDNCQELCVRLAQTFLVQDWIRPERKCCTQDLLKLWIRLQYLADKDQEKFLDSIWAVAKVSRVTEQIGTLIDTVKKECGFTFFQLYVDLCIYAINIDKGFLEKEVVEGDMEAVRKRQFAVSKTCHRLADLFMDSNFRLSKISVLTAFALNPTQGAFELVNKLFWIIKKQKKSENVGKINPATVYEVERLLNMLRPFYLNPELPWKELIPLCRKYKVEQEENMRANISPKMTAPLSFGLSTPSTSSCVKEISQQSSMPESAMQRNICNFINLTGKKQTSSSTKSTVRAGVSSVITEMPQKIQSRDTSEVSNRSNMAKRDLQLQTKEQNLCAWNASVLPGTSGLDFSALKIGDVGIEMLRRHYTLQSFGESANLTDDNKGQLGHRRTAKEIQSKMEAQLLAHDISMLQLKHKSRKNESKVETDSAQDGSRMAVDSSKTHNSQKMNALGRSMQRSLDPDQISALLSLTNQTKSVNDTPVRSSSVPVNRFQKDLVSFSAAQKMALGREPHEMSPDSYRQHVMELIKAATATREVSSYCEKPQKKSSGSPKKKTVSRQKSVGSSPSISPSTSHLQKSSPSFIENSNNSRLKGPALSQTDPAKIASMIEASGFSNKLQPKMKAESNRKHVSESLQDCQNKNSSLLKPVISMVVPKSVAEGAMTGTINKEALFKTISELISEKVLDKDSSVPRTVVSNIPIVSKNPLHQSSHLTVGTTTTGSIAVKTSIVSKSGHSYTSEQLSGKTETSQSIPSRYSRSLSLPSFISSTSSPLIQQISSKERVGVSIENSFIDQATGTLNRSHSMGMVEMNAAISSCSNSYRNTFGMGAQPNVGLPALSNNVCVTDSQGFNLVALSNSNPMQPMSIFNATSFAGLPDLSGLMNENIDIQQLLNTQPALLDSPVTCASLHNYLQQTSIASMPVSTQSMLQNITQVHSHGPVLGTQQIVTLSGVANVSASPQVITTFVPRHSAMQDSVQMSDQHGQIQVHTASSPFCQQTMPDLQVVKEPIELTSQQSVIHQLSLPNQGIVQESVQFTGQQSTFQTASLPLVQQTLQRQEDSVRWAEQQPLIQIQNSCSPFSQQSAVVDAGNVELPGQILTIPQSPVMQHTVNVISVQNATTPTFIQQIPTPELDANVVQQILSIIEQGPGTPTRLDGSSAPHTSNQHFIHQQNDDFSQTGRTPKMGLQPAVCKTSYILPKGVNQPLIDKTKMLLLKKDNFAGSGKTVSEAIEQIVSQKFAKELQKGAKPPDVNTKPATIAKSRPAKGKTNVLSSTSCVQSDMRVAASTQLASVKNTYENATSTSSGALNLPVQLERPSSVPLNSSFNLQKTFNTRSANESHACDPKLLGLLLENKVFGIQTGRTSSSTASVPSPVLQPGAVPCANVSSSSTAVGQSSEYQASSTNGTSSRLLGMASISPSSSVGEMSQNVTSFLTAVSGILQVAPKVPVQSSSAGDQTQIPASVTVTQIPIPRAFMGSAWSTANAGVKKGDGQVVSSKNTSISTTCVSPSSKASFSPLPALSVSASQEKSSMTYSIASALSTVKESYSSSTLSQITSHNQIRAVPGKSCTVQTCVSPTTSVVTSMAASTSVPVTTVVQCLTTSVPATYHQGTFSVNAQNTVDSPKTSAIQTSASDISCSFTNSSGSCSIDGSSCSFSSNRARSQPYSTSLIESLLLRGSTTVSTGPSESIQTKNGSEFLDERLLRKLLFQQSGRQQISEHVQDNFQPVYQQTLPSPVLSLLGADSVPSSAFGTRDHLLDPFSTTKQASLEENDKDSEPFLNNVPGWNQKSCKMEEKLGLNSQGVSVFTPCLTVAAGTLSSQYSDSGSAEQMNRKHSENLCACDVTLLSAGRGEQSQTGQGALPNSKSCTSGSFREGSALTAHSSDSRNASSSDCDVLQQMQIEENDGISECPSQESCLVVKPTGELKLISDITDFKTQSNIQQLALEKENSGAHNRLKNISDSEQKSTLNEYWAYEGGKVVMKTNSSAVLVNKCAICEQLFKSVEELRNHVVTVCKHSQKIQMSDVKDFEFKTQFSCSNCNFMSISEKIAKKHISNCKIFGTAGVENFESQTNVAKLTLVFTCKMCGKISKDKDDIHEHVSKLCTELKKFSSGREHPSQSLCWEMSELPEKEIPISGRRHSLVNSVDILEEVKVGELTTGQLTSADEERKLKDQDGTLFNTQQQDLKLADEKVSKVRSTKVYSEKDIFKVSDWDSPRKLSSTVPKVSDWDSPRKLSSVYDSLDGKAKMEQAVGNKFIYDKGENSVHIDQVEHYAEEEMARDSEDIGPRESSKEKENMNLEDIEITSTLVKDNLKKSNDNREEVNVDTKALVNISKSTYSQKDYSEHMQNYHVTADKDEVAKGKTVCENKSQKKVKMKTLSTEEIRKQRLKGLRDKRLIKRRKFLDEEMDDSHKEASSKRLVRRAKVRQPVSAPKEKRHECTSCAGRFYLRTELIKHIGFKHLQAFRFIRPDRFICRYCKTMFPTCIGVLNHMIQHTQTILESVNRKQHAADQRSRLAAKLNEIRKTSSRSTQSRLAAQKVTRKSLRFTSSSHRNRPIITDSTQESSGKDIKGQKSFVKKPASKVTRDKACNEGICLESQNGIQTKRLADKVAAVKEERVERRGRPRKLTPDPKKEMKKTDDKGMKIERQGRPRYPIPETSPRCPIPETSPRCSIPETSPRGPIPETKVGKLKMFKNGEIRVERRGRPRKYPIIQNKEVNCHDRNSVTELVDSIPLTSSKDVGRETRSGKKYLDVGLHNSDSDTRQKKESHETEEERNKTGIHQTPQKDQYCKQDDDDQKREDSVKDDIMPTRRSVRFNQSTKEQAEIRMEPKEVDEVKNTVQKVDNRVETRQLRASVDKMLISDDKSASDLEAKISRTPKKGDKLDLKADNDLGSSKRMSTRSKVKHEAAIGSDSEDNISLYSNSESTQGDQRTIDSLRIRRVSTRQSKLDAESKAVGNDNFLKAENARNSLSKHKSTSVESDQTKSLSNIKSSSRNSMPLHFNSADNILSETDKKVISDRSPSRRRSTVSRDNVINSSDGNDDKISKEKNMILKERQSSRGSTLGKSRKRKRSFSGGSNSSLSRHNGQKSSENDTASKDTSSETERITRSKITLSSLVKGETSKVESQAHDRKTRSKQSVSGDRALDNEKKKEIETHKNSFSPDGMNPNIKEKSKRSARSVSPIVEKETLKTESIRKTVQDTKKMSNDKSPIIGKESETKLKMDPKSISRNKSVQIVSKKNCDKQGKTAKVKRSGSSYTFKRKFSLRREDKGRSRKLAARIVKKKAAVNSFLVKSRSSLRKAKLNLAKSQRLKTSGQNSTVSNSTKKCVKMEQLCKSGYVKLSLQRLSVLLPADDEEFAAVKSPPTTVLKVKEKSPVACRSEKDTSKTVTIKVDNGENLHQGKRKGNDFISNQKDSRKKIKMQKSDESNETTEVDEEQGTKKANTVENSETDGHKDTESSIIKPPSFETAFRQFASGNSGVIVQPLNHKELNVIQKDSLHSKLPTSRNFLSAFEEFASSPITYSRRRNYINSQISIAASQYIPVGHLNRDSSRNLYQPDESLADHNLKTLSKDAKDDEMSHSKDSTGTQTEEVAMVDEASEAQTEGVSKGDRYQLPDLDKNVSNIQYPDIEKSKGSYMSSFLTYVANYTNDGTGVDSENSCDGKDSDKVSLQSERLKNFREQHNSVGFTWDMSDGDVQCPTNSSASKKRTSREQKDSKTQTKSNVSKNHSEDGVQGNAAEASSSTSVKKTGDLVDEPCSADLAMEKKAPGKSDKSPSSVHKETSTKYYMPRKPVRHIYHGGKVWEIQKGSIKSTIVVQSDRQVTATDLSKKSLSKMDSGVHTVQEDKLRLRSSSSQEEAQEGTAQDWSREKSVQAGDLNNYICKTLNEIRKQRNQQRNPSNSKWQVQKKKPDVKKFPYSFTRSRKIH